MNFTNGSRRALLGGAALAAATAAMPERSARAQGREPDRPKLRLGIITDLSGPYADLSRPAEACARQALEDFGVSARGWDVDVLVADHQHKTDVAAATARRWFDQDGVDALVDVSTSATALAINGMAREKNKVFLATEPGTSELTGTSCSPNTIHWVWDTAMLARSLGSALLAQGQDSWFFLGADYAFGHQMARDTAAVVQAKGGRVAGSVFHPFPGTSDFSSFLLRAQSSRAKVLGICNAGADLINTVKQAREFGLDRSMKIVGMLTYDTVIHGLGLETAQGMQIAASYYWDLNDRTRAWQARVHPKTPNLYPNMGTAGIYSAVLHYLKVAADMGVAEAKRDGRATVARMKAMPTDDDCFGAGTIRDDGRKMHPAYILEAKTPAESRHSWDLLKTVAVVPPEEAFRPMSEGGCPLVRG
ncbi:amino acid/amide ABC transporter substrate-binding protein (HAAT family) [Humitalea rosea]|uniref:Amino acid/amide ABC transporter substrate-binding protein (HAAT family) n=1 Tax=Humitalea rosea TaxID=990373 RepID=A0A2W7HYU7_9PROT|nr:ABC transporter substrate-binding protein [Humitalea rosea]PZW37848.1 amino acid/amide ABC transporter substrate-binding protein (HAAT family) [Humitalea rosea]